MRETKFQGTLSHAASKNHSSTCRKVEKMVIFFKFAFTNDSVPLIVRTTYVLCYCFVLDSLLGCVPSSPHLFAPTIHSINHCQDNLCSVTTSTGLINTQWKTGYRCIYNGHPWDRIS